MTRWLKLDGLIFNMPLYLLELLSLTYFFEKASPLYFGIRTIWCYILIQILTLLSFLRWTHKIDLNSSTSALDVLTLLRPSLKYFQIAPNEKNKAIKLVKQELLKHTLMPTIVAAIDSQSITSAKSLISNAITSVHLNDLLDQEIN